MNDIIPPGACIGILGGGQLGRMTAMAAARLGYRTAILAPDQDAPAADVAAHHLRSDYTDPAAIERFAGLCDVITLEFENVPVDALEALAQRRPVRPCADVLRVTQDRLAEKGWLSRNGIPVAPFRAIAKSDDLLQGLRAFDGRGVLKTTRLGYDGRGQVVLESEEKADDALAALGDGPMILEAFVDFDCEISIIAARNPQGAIACFPAALNAHRDHVLRTSTAPAPLPAALAEKATDLARAIASRLDLEGLIAVEMFVTRSGEILVNELAPRPHNSGHWSIEGCTVSQFEQHVRAVCGLPLGEPRIIAPAVMENLLGDEILRWPELLAEPGAHLHIYGKAEIRPGRKMGHVTRLRPTGDPST